MDTSTVVGRMRLLTGDYYVDEPILTDDIYLYFYENNKNSELEGAIEALESIINNIALAPTKWRTGEVWEEAQNVAALERRLNDLKARKSGRVVPVIVRSDRTNWDDFDKVFK